MWLRDKAQTGKKHHGEPAVAAQSVTKCHPKPQQGAIRTLNSSLALRTGPGRHPDPGERAWTIGSKSKIFEFERVVHVLAPGLT
jgi:hypothetical protein